MFLFSMKTSFEGNKDKTEHFLPLGKLSHWVHAEGCRVAVITYIKTATGPKRPIGRTVSLMQTKKTCKVKSGDESQF